MQNPFLRLSVIFAKQFKNTMRKNPKIKITPNPQTILKQCQKKRKQQKIHILLTQKVFNTHKFYIWNFFVEFNAFVFVEETSASLCA